MILLLIAIKRAYAELCSFFIIDPATLPLFYSFFVLKEGCLLLTLRAPSRTTKMCFPRDWIDDGIS
jgi:hypothetical protein